MKKYLLFVCLLASIQLNGVGDGRHANITEFHNETEKWILIQNLEDPVPGRQIIMLAPKEHIYIKNALVHTVGHPEKTPYPFPFGRIDIPWVHDGWGRGIKAFIPAQGRAIRVSYAQSAKGPWTVLYYIAQGPTSAWGEWTHGDQSFLRNRKRNVIRLFYTPDPGQIPYAMSGGLAPRPMLGYNTAEPSSRMLIIKNVTHPKRGGSILDMKSPFLFLAPPR